MLLTSGTYFIFLIFVFLAYWMIAERHRPRTLFLLAVGYFFYAQGGLLPLALLFAVTTIDYGATRLLIRTETPWKRKALLGVSFISGFGSLGVFKYADFFASSVADGLGFLGIHLQAKPLNLLVPVGLSFFVFQSAAYVIDVYRKDIRELPDFDEYLSFVSFFPTLTAGPILRARQFFPQLRGDLKLDSQAGGQALFLIAVGLLKKVAVADYLSTNFVDRVFDFPDRFSSLEVLTAVYGYALQIYMDFSGYSDIAIGSALLVGFRLPENFDAPYRSRNLPEFWRRWHISLSTWLRDYVFFSVVGRRPRNTLILYAGSVVTMLVGGLWHGATWTFVFWGLLHGVGLVVVRLYETAAKRRGFALPDRAWINGLCLLATFHFVCLTWIFFRSETVGQAFSLVRHIFDFTADTTNLPFSVLIVMVVGFASHWTPKRLFEGVRTGFVELPAYGQAAVLFLLALGLHQVATSDVMPFIYARF